MAYLSSMSVGAVLRVTSLRASCRAWSRNSPLLQWRAAVRGPTMPGRRALYAALAILMSHVIIASHAMLQHSCSGEEGCDVLDGLLICSTGRHNIDPVRPPLIKMLSALPVFFLRPVMPEYSYVGDIFAKQNRFAIANGERYMRIIWCARCVALMLSVVCGATIYLWSRELYGAAGSLVSLLIWCWSPFALTWAGTGTVDMGATAVGTFFVYQMRKYVCEESLFSAIRAGMWLGVAQLASFTLLTMYFVWLAACVYLAVCYARRPRCNDAASAMSVASNQQRLWRAPLRDCSIGAAMSLLVINAGYGFDDSFRRLGSFTFHSFILTPRGARDVSGRWSRDLAGGNRFKGTVLENMRVPLPAAFIVGVDWQKAYADYGKPGYLGGTWRRGGWWYYYLYAALLKTPLSGLLVIGAAGILAISSSVYRLSAVQETLLVLPCALILILLSTHTGVNAHARYALPAFPFIAIWAGRLGRLVAGHSLNLRGSSDARAKWKLAASRGCLWSIAATSALELALVHPHYLSYFNQLVGGPINGWRFLAESNMDWGQDLLFLKHWQDLTDKPVYLACYSTVDPRVYGIRFKLAPFDLHSAGDDHRSVMLPGLYAISTNFLCGFADAAYDEHGQLVRIPTDAFRSWRTVQPIASAGYSIYIFEIPSCHQEP